MEGIQEKVGNLAKEFAFDRISSHSVNHPLKKALTTFHALGRSLSLKSAVLRENGARSVGDGFSV